MEQKYIEKAKSVIESIDQEFVDANLAKLYYEGEECKKLWEEAVEIRRNVAGDNLYIRGSLEYSNYCSNSCAFCGMAESNANLLRYELSFEDVKKPIQMLIQQGVTQLHIVTGESKGINIDKICDVVKYAASKDLSITLVLGEREENEYRKLYEAGARRYIIKFETSNANAYRDSKGGKDLYERIGNLYLLRDVGFKIGTGIISGLPGTNDVDLMRDLYTLKSIAPDMASVSVFSPNEQSRFCMEKPGDKFKTLNFVSLMRTELKTTPIITCSSSFGAEFQREALNAGANLLSFHITPKKYAKDFSMYKYENRIMTQYNHIAKSAERGNLKIAKYI